MSDSEIDPRAYADSINATPLPKLDNGLSSQKADKFRNMAEKMDKFLSEGMKPDNSVDPGVTQTLAVPGRPTVPVVQNTRVDSMNTVFVEDHQVRVSLGCSIPVDSGKQFPFAVHFTARKVDIEDDSVSIFMNDVLSLTLPKIYVELQLSVNDVKYDVIYAGSSMKIGPYRVLSFLIVK